MTWSSWVSRIGGLVLVAGAASPAELILPQNPEQAIRVRLYDYAGVSAATLARAKAAASHVLAQAGVRLAWAECRIHQDHPPKDHDCELPITRIDLQLRIIDAGPWPRVLARRATASAMRCSRAVATRLRLSSITARWNSSQGITPTGQPSWALCWPTKSGTCSWNDPVIPQAESCGPSGATKISS